MTQGDEMLVLTAKDRQDVLVFQLRQLVDSGLLKVTSKGHYAVVWHACKSCGRELHANAPNNIHGAIGYCPACRSAQLRQARRDRAITVP